MNRRGVVLLSVVVLGAAACTGSSETSDVTVTEPAGTSAGTSDTTEAGDTPIGDFCRAIAAIRSAQFEVEETFGRDARRLFEEVQSAAPPEVADDVETVIATLDAIAELGLSADDDDPEAVDDAYEILLDPNFTEANERLEEYTSDECGIDLGDGDDIDLDDLQDIDGA